MPAKFLKTCPKCDTSWAEDKTLLMSVESITCPYCDFEIVLAEQSNEGLCPECGITMREDKTNPMCVKSICPYCDFEIMLDQQETREEEE